MNKLKYYPIAILLLFSCMENVKKQKIVNVVDATNAKTQVTYSIDDSLEKERLKSILLRDKDIPPYNKRLLQNILKNMDNRFNGEDELGIDEDIFGIFTLKKGETGIFTYPVYKEDNNKSIVDVSGEAKMLPRGSSQYSTETEKKVPNIMDSLYKKGKAKSVYVYSFDKRFSTDLRDFFYYDNCRKYYRYSLTLKKNEPLNILLGSKYPLELLYGEYSEIDSLLKEQYKIGESPSDCPNSYHLARTFAKLKGTDNVFFVYADTFPLNNKLDEPMRGLVMNIEGKIVYIWSSNLDLFGCICL